MKLLKRNGTSRYLTPSSMVRSIIHSLLLEIAAISRQDIRQKCRGKVKGHISYWREKKQLRSQSDHEKFDFGDIVY